MFASFTIFRNHKNVHRICSRVWSVSQSVTIVQSPSVINEEGRPSATTLLLNGVVGGCLDGHPLALSAVVVVPQGNDEFQKTTSCKGNLFLVYKEMRFFIDVYELVPESKTAFKRKTMGANAEGNSLIDDCRTDG